MNKPLHKAVSHAAYRAEKAAEVLAQFRESVLAIDPDLANDLDALRDTLDGETGVIDLIRRFCRDHLEYKDLAANAASAEKDVKARKKRFEAGAATFKQYAGRLLEMAGLDGQPFREGDFTASFRTVQGGTLVIPDPDAIPAQYRRQETVWVPDKEKLTEALNKGKSSEELGGAYLSQGGRTLVISRK